MASSNTLDLDKDSSTEPLLVPFKERQSELSIPDDNDDDLEIATKTKFNESRETTEVTSDERKRIVVVALVATQWLMPLLVLSTFCLVNQHPATKARETTVAEVGALRLASALFFLSICLNLIFMWGILFLGILGTPTGWWCFTPTIFWVCLQSLCDFIYFQLNDPAANDLNVLFFPSYAAILLLGFPVALFYCLVWCRQNLHSRVIDYLRQAHQAINGLLLVLPLVAGLVLLA